MRATDRTEQLRGKGIVMEMNSEGVHLLAGGQNASSQLLWTSAGRLTSAAAEFVPAQAGRDYQDHGAQIQSAMEAIGVRVTGWAAAVEQNGSSLATSANVIADSDGTAAAGINSIEGAQ
ncbi:hypothetical protein [Nocardia salmonicida]|uniref:hypothetical protein n=1 Tax=Nocardia salmonicida TaxID=53431 RepID=UPI0007A46CFC|nr:hypothetical protein [Nocardia salmonicida]